MNTSDLRGDTSGMKEEMDEKIPKGEAKTVTVEGTPIRVYRIVPEDEPRINWKTKVLPIGGFMSLNINENIHIGDIIIDPDEKKVILSYYEQ